MNGLKIIIASTRPGRKGPILATRSIQLLKPVLTSLDMVLLTAAVNVPFFTKFIKDNKFEATDDQNKMAEGLFTELKRWSHLLTHMRGTVLTKG